MNSCQKCGRPIITPKEFEELISRPYLLAITDKEFFEKLQKEADSNGAKL